MTEEFETVVQSKIEDLTRHIEALELYKNSLITTLNIARNLSEGECPMEHFETRSNRPDKLVQILTEGPALREELPSSLEMTRTVLRNLGGEPKAPDDLRALIRETYGVEPVKTLDQMLYKRASKGQGFFKTHDGRFGLTEFQPIVQQDRVPSTAMC